MTLGDRLLALIQERVRNSVPAHLQTIVTELTVRSLVTILSDPTFTSELLIVQELLEEIANLQLQLALKQPTKKRSPAPKKPINPLQEAFQQGFEELR